MNLKGWFDNPIGGASRSWNAKIEHYEKWMADHGLGDYLIDEVALYFPNYSMLNAWVVDAVKEEGVTLFNTAGDRVHTFPFCTDYEVEYYFLKHEAMPWRVEAMVVREGASPLHFAVQANLERAGKVLPSTVHFSFKVPTEEFYREAMYRLREAGADPAQFCDSTYGSFSYWRIEDLHQHGHLYLKPRVNKRDDPTYGMPASEMMQDRPKV